jgi:hypothetical protein
MTHSENSQLDVNLSRWTEPRYLGQSAMCANCLELIVVIDDNTALDGTRVYEWPNLQWQHITGYYACGNPGTYPQAEPKVF